METVYLLWCQIQPLDNQECSFVGDVAAKEWTRLYASGAWSSNGNTQDSQEIT